MKAILLLFISVISMHINAAENSLGFDFDSFSGTVDDVLLVGDATVSSGVLHLTNYDRNNVTEYQNSVGRMYHRQPIHFTPDVSFLTKFSFSAHVLNSSVAGHGMAFVVASDKFVNQSLSYVKTCYGGNLGLVTVNGILRSNEFVSVEFDTWKNPLGGAYNDMDDNHVALDVDSVASVVSTGRNELRDRYGVDFKSGSLINVWIDYYGKETLLSVFLSANQSTIKPDKPVLKYSIDISKVLNSNTTFFGFTSATGKNYEINSLYTWHLKASAGNLLRGNNKSKTPDSKTVGIIVGGGVLGICLVTMVWWFIRLRRDSKRSRESGASRFTYKELIAATGNFHDKNVLGRGGFGTVYKGVLATSESDRVEVAIKRFSQHSQQGGREFTAEITTIARLSHRNIVHLYGWCEEKENLLLVYEYMPNGSLDKWLGGNKLSWERRYAIVCGVAAGLHYMHEEWEKRIVHRDLKPSNIVLDADFNGKIGDFGLARTGGHSVTSNSTTGLAGTPGYIAPEIAQTMKPTASSDVFSFGILALEVASGRRQVAVIDNVTRPELSLVDCAQKLNEEGRLMELADDALEECYDASEMELLLVVGVACSRAEPQLRPTMRHVLHALRKDAPFSFRNQS